MTDLPWLAIVLYLLGINLLTPALFAFDKHRARRRRWRISERSLLFLCFIGGTPGAYWARKTFRHKTRKQPFSIRLHSIAVLQCLTCLGLIWQVLPAKDF
ncbi:DUF1294 domain-containing protein [Parasedimentitalea marina]|uniref:DUF1294 domain-containing protein n=1 Tax=Parasedimentitalea marina TaxID=2483033 RepID=A0A3T0N941_9RHOB|nr:DUF1294 domain-containing protein [Parasedimentitalea marina]AZV80548.1 DUF1294 domain-containing protein [Parasedimentitalea marina]